MHRIKVLGKTAVMFKKARMTHLIVEHLLLRIEEMETRSAKRTSAAAALPTRATDAPSPSCPRGTEVEGEGKGRDTDTMNAEVTLDQLKDVQMGCQKNSACEDLNRI